MNIVLGIEYFGRHFHGWQKQPKVRTVQGCLEQALSKVADEPIDVICAGRTDAGVHGFGQVINFTSNANRNEDNWLLGANRFLPPDIKVTWVKFVDDKFNARFSATARRYQYIIYNQAIRPAIFNYHLSFEPRPLDIELMQQASSYFLGEQDFNALRSSKCQSHTSIRNIHHLNVELHDKSIIIDVKANAFLHHMVRNIAGVLIAIGHKEKPPEWAKQVIEGKNRQHAGKTAEPNGLYLMEVDYPAHFALPLVPIKTLFI